MFRFKARSLAVMAIGLTLLGAVLALALSASSLDTTASVACDNGGYLDYTDADRNVFRDERDCAARGGAFRFVGEAGLSIAFDRSSDFGGSVMFIPSSLLPGSTITRESILLAGIPVSGAHVGTVDAHGGFTARAGFRCGTVDTITVRGVDADGITTSISEAPPC